MKKIILAILLCLFVCGAWSQNYDSTGIRFDTSGYNSHLTSTFVTQPNDEWSDPNSYLNYPLQYLDMNKVPKGVLYDKVLSLADLFSFKDDAGQKPSSNPLHFHQAYFEYYHALIDSTNTTHPDSLISIIEKDYSANTHPFVLLKADIATIKKDAIDSGILTIDSAYCLHENSNSTTSPYDVQSVSLTSLGLISRLQSQTIRLMAPNPTTPN